MRTRSQSESSRVELISSSAGAHHSTATARAQFASWELADRPLQAHCAQCMDGRPRQRRRSGRVASGCAQWQVPCSLPPPPCVLSC